jgi:hypothetical protein
MVWLVLHTPDGGSWGGPRSLEARTTLAVAILLDATLLSVSFLFLIITSTMDTSTLMAYSSLTTMPCNVCDGRIDPTYSPQGGVFVI